MADPGLLIVDFAVEPNGEEMINRWYNEEHVPDRLAIEGFEGVARFRSVDGTLHHMTIWEVADASWPFDPTYRSIPMDSWADRIGHLRGPSTRSGWVELTGQLPAPAPDVRTASEGLRMVKMHIPAANEAEFHAWYEQEHVPDLMLRPEYVGVRRFRSLHDDGFLALWYLTEPLLHQSGAYAPPPPTAAYERLQAYRRSAHRSSWSRIPVRLPG